MKRITATMMVLVVMTLIADIVVRLTKPAPVIVNGMVTGIPLISSWIDVVLAVEFGIPAVMEIYSRFLSSPKLSLRIQGSTT